MKIALVLIHEVIHAEIMERCVQLGIITSLIYNSTWEASLNFGDGTLTTTDFPSTLFAMLVANYSNYVGATTSSSNNWQHDLFNVLNYRAKIAEDLRDAHILLDDTLNPFENNLNNGTMFDLTIDEYFNLMSWYGLEETQDYDNLSPLGLTKITQAINQTELFYNENCN